MKMMMMEPVCYHFIVFDVAKIMKYFERMHIHAFFSHHRQLPCRKPAGERAKIASTRTS